MRFTDGYWLTRPGVAIYSPQDVRDVEITKTAVVLYIAPFAVEQRGQTLAGPLLTVRFTSPQLGILATEACHFMGSALKEVRFELADENLPLEVTQSEGSLTI